MRIDTYGHGVEINNDAEVLNFNNPNSNGYVHIINKVLSPPKNLVDIISDDYRFDTFKDALYNAELVRKIRNGDFTLFVPSNMVCFSFRDKLLLKILLIFFG